MVFGGGDNLMVNFVVVVMLVLLNWFSSAVEAFGTFGFDIHHRYSDPVKGFLDLDGLPEQGTVDYFSAMAQRDRLFHGRRLAGTTVDSTLSFRDSNETNRISAFGFLHYATVSVGTPSSQFFVALDTGSDLFWLPCDCVRCVKGIQTSQGILEFNIYSTNTSTTSMKIPCNSTSCRLRSQCPTLGGCPYQVNYLSQNTSSTGILVEDVLHLATDHTPQRNVEARIKFGCGMIQTGSFLKGGAPNGLFGLGMDNISVPSILASEGLAANSFSMCFGQDGTGRINFGDKGSLDQGETPFNVETPHPSYNISITRVNMDQNVTDIAFTAIFDSGTSFTYLNDPAYTIMGESFFSMIKERRLQTNSGIPFEFCYEQSSSQPVDNHFINLTMKGGDEFHVTSPTVEVQTDGGVNLTCLGIVRSHDINIIGQNFMTGYRVVFDRERMILGWKPSNCYDALASNTLPVDPRFSPAATPSPTASVMPEAASRNGGSPTSAPSSPSSIQGNDSPLLITLSYTLLALLILVNSFIIL